MSKKIKMAFQVENSLYDKFKSKIEKERLTISGFYNDKIKNFNNSSIKIQKEEVLKNRNTYIDKATVKAFNDKCKKLNLNMSEIIRGWIKEYIEK